LNKDTISDDEFKRRIRIMRNLIENSDDEIREDRMINLIAESKTIILTGVIPNSKKGELGFNDRQKDEECNKIEWLKNNPKMADTLFRLEDHDLLHGCIAIVGLDAVNNFNKFRLLFDTCNKDLINRALLVTGDYSQFLHDPRYCKIGAKNDSVWIALFHPTKQRGGFDRTSTVLNALLSKFEETDITEENIMQLVNKYLDDSATKKDKRYYLVKYESMRQGSYGMFYGWNNEEEKYRIFMMNTRKNIGGKNWNIFLNTLYKLPEFSEQLSLGDYAHQGDKLKINGTDIEIDCRNDKFTIFRNGQEEEIKILQKDGIDIEDRVIKGIDIIREALEARKSA
jgi:hypothetical protein